MLHCKDLRHKKKQKKKAKSSRKGRVGCVVNFQVACRVALRQGAPAEPGCADFVWCALVWLGLAGSLLYPITSFRFEILFRRVSLGIPYACNLKLHISFCLAFFCYCCCFFSRCLSTFYYFFLILFDLQHIFSFLFFALLTPKQSAVPL